jgi:hypothetical protein
MVKSRCTIMDITSTMKLPNFHLSLHDVVNRRKIIEPLGANMSKNRKARVSARPSITSITSTVHYFPSHLYATEGNISIFGREIYAQGVLVVYKTRTARPARPAIPANAV